MAKNPGPIDNRLLFDQHNHISSKVWDLEQETDRDKPRITNITSNAGIKQWVLNDRQQELVRETGFGFLLRPGNVVRTDVSLLNALIERWRPETNTFHLPVGECTITLEDVWFILGIPPSGQPIIEAPLKKDQICTFSEFFKTTAISEDDCDSEGIKFVWLRAHYAKLPAKHTEEDEETAVKAFLLDGIGSVLIPDGSKNKVNGRYCKFLSDLSKVIGYAWGAAILARLYRALYKATRCKDSGIFMGCSTLLQIWAWTRVAVSRPNPRPKSEYDFPRVNAYAFDGTKGDTYKRNWRKVGPHHSGTLFARGEMDLYPTHSMFNWEPYSHFYTLEIENSPYGFYKEIGCSCIPLIHFLDIEYQLPNRVTRQFGYPVEIPENPRVNLNIYRTYQKKSDFERVNAVVVYGAQVEEWYANVVMGRNAVYEPNPDRQVPLDEYITWFRNITRIRINPPNFGEAYVDEWCPRDLYDQKGCYKLVEDAAACISSSQKYIPAGATDYIEQATSWASRFQNWNRENIDATYDFNVFGNEYHQSQQSQVTDDVYCTPHEQQMKDVAIEDGQTKTVPAAPLKDKGKRPARDKVVVDGAPSFDLGMDFSESQGSGQNYRMPGYEDGGDMYRPVPEVVRRGIEDNWYSKEGQAALKRIKMLGGDFLSIATLKCLMPEEELWEQVMSAYIKLLMARERARPPVAEGGNQRRTYWVADISFLGHCDMGLDDFLKWDKKRGAKGRFKYNGNVSSMLRGGKGEQPGVDKGRDWALIPFLKRFPNGSNHYSLFVVNLRNMTTLIVDSLWKDRKTLMSKFKEELNLVFVYFASVLRDEFKMDVPIFRDQERPIYVTKNAPRQENGTDCGVFVLRAMDCYLRDEEGLENKVWTQDQIVNFRYWIAWELWNNRARG